MSEHPNDSLRDHRWAMTQDFGASVLDSVMVDWTCPGCGLDLADDKVRTIGAVAYSDVRSLVASAAKMAKGWLREPPECGPCGQTGQGVRSHYHAFHAAPGRDLVVRVEGSSEPQLLWWD